MARLLKFIFYIISFFHSAANARIYDVYRADYMKGPFCTAIGGACASDPDFDNSFFQNPASLEAGHENWDYDYDYNKSGNPEPGTNKNNTLEESSFMAGALYAGETWGYGFSVSVMNTAVHTTAVLIDEQDRARSIVIDERARTYMFSFPVGFKVNSNLSLGASLSALFQHHELDVDHSIGTASKPKNEIPFPTLNLGAIYQDQPSLRFGVWAKLPNIYSYSLGLQLQSFGNTVNYQEDIVLYFPWMLNFGVSYIPFKDERTLFFDLDIIGSSENSFLQSFDALSSSLKNKDLVEKGRSIVIEPRIGWRSAWTRGSSGTYMLGSYYENSRWQNESGRLHATMGLSYKWNVNFFIFETVELMGGLDLAPNYQQVFVTYR